MTARYTCTDYRTEMIWLALQRRSADPQLTECERRELQAELQALESAMERQCRPPEAG
jgi:hypothetical protein